MGMDIIICECHSVEHQLIFRYDKEYNDVYISVHLYDYHTGIKGFFIRLWRGIKYAFGYKCKYGAWDEIIVEKEKFKKIIKKIK